MGGADRDSTMETGVMGVCEGSVCASVQNMEGGGGGGGVRLTSRVRLSLCEQLVRS